MKMSPGPITLAAGAAALLALAVGCGSSNGGGNRPAQAPPVASAETQSPDRLMVEPQGATLVQGGKLAITSIALRSGKETLELSGLTGLGNFRTGIEEEDGGQVSLSLPAAGSSGHAYTAPDRTGTFHVNFATGSQFESKARIPVKVVEPPTGKTVFLDQRQVQVSPGNRVALTIQTLGRGHGDLPGDWRVRVVEPEGGLLENIGPEGARTTYYKAPATPGTYHVVLYSPAEPGVEKDRVVFTVVPQAP